MAIRFYVLLICSVYFASSLPTKGRKQATWDTDHLHPAPHGDWVNPPYTGPWFDWAGDAKKQLVNAEQYYERLSSRMNKRAKNVIFIMGDGMGISTITAARVYKAQKEKRVGADAVLSWEKMPMAALSRTYSAYETTADSAATATAMVCGEKTGNSVICANQNVTAGVCSTWIGNSLPSVLHEAQDAGKWTGVVTTARITHASPACTYASSPHRNWEDHTAIEEDCDEGDEICSQCKDIAYQLVKEERNKDIRVILGGGREHFFMYNETDVEDGSEAGNRRDENLKDAWLEGKSERARYVWNLEDFSSTEPADTDYLFGLFGKSHMEYEQDRVDEDLHPEGPTEPSLAQMVDKSIDILSRNPDGYFLFVESGRIDHAHHENLAKHALEDTVALSLAVETAINKTSEEDTMIVVTADHSHVFTIGGYPTRDKNILGIAINNEYFDPRYNDGKPVATLGYTNGPGYLAHRTNDNNISYEKPRMNLTGMEDEMTGKDWLFDAGVFLSSETHGGEDVGIYARGPMAHYLHGVQEQSYIAHVMRYAMCVGSYAEENDCPGVPSHATSLPSASAMLTTITAAILYFVR